MAIPNSPFPSPSAAPPGNGPIDLSPGASQSPSDAAAGSGELLNRVVRGAHDTIDRLAGQAAPQLQKLEDGMAGASDALHDQAQRLRKTGDQWTESLRGTVREHPLAAIGAALALGILIARLTR